LHTTLQSFLDEARNGALVFEDVDWFEEGAVYLKMEETHGYRLVNEMRLIVEKECAEHHIGVLPMTHFHVTLFKQNVIPKDADFSGRILLGKKYTLPIGAALHMGDDVVIGANKGMIDTVELRQVKKPLRGYQPAHNS